MSLRWSRLIVETCAVYGLPEPRPKEAVQRLSFRVNSYGQGGLLYLCGLLLTALPLAAQLPFYTDDTNVTAPWKFHFEFFNEFDSLQQQDPNLRQNTANYKFNVGLPHNLEIDLDNPYLAIFRSLGNPNSSGTGDLNLGVKWRFHDEGPRTPAVAASLYIEFPTGDSNQQLGSGLTDYWLNFIAQKTFAKKTRLTGNAGYLFAGNTSTGALGIQGTRGHVFAGGLSLQHDLTDRLTLGGELFGGVATESELGRSQLQGMLGGQYALRPGLGLSFGILGGKYIASPRIGAQIGVSIDFPEIIRPKS